MTTACGAAVRQRTARASMSASTTKAMSSKAVGRVAPLRGMPRRAAQVASCLSGPDELSHERTTFNGHHFSLYKDHETGARIVAELERSGIPHSDISIIANNDSGWL